MSPIKNPENYPADWKEIRGYVLKRAGDRCECDGLCGADHAITGLGRHRCGEKNGEEGRSMRGKVVLTVAHLNHDASAGDHSFANLAALCQACHLRYDAPHNARKARKTREERAGVFRLFEEIA